jgi:hypothetical protein
MNKNMGTVDKIIRISLAVLIIILYAAGQISGTAAIILGLFAAIFIVTSFVSFCPLYYPFKLSTRGNTIKQTEKI